MGQTIVEKIFSRHSNEEAVPGKIIWINLDVRTARDFAGANVVKSFRKNFPNETVADASRTFFTFDCNAPANTIAYAENQQICRNFAREHNIKVFDVDAGIGSHIMLEEGIALPGNILVGTDSHLNILGAVSCFGQGMGDTDIAFAFRTGRTWFEVPETIRINLNGNFQYPASAKDLILYLLGQLGAAGALGKCVEIHGEITETLTFQDRITIASMATEMGAISIMIPPSEEIIKILAKKAKFSFEPALPDSDANYAKEFTFDISGLQPYISRPHHPEDTCPVNTLGNVRVDSVMIGSCTNGSIQDMRIAASILKDRTVAPGVMLKIVPATRQVYGDMIKEKLIDIMYEAGAIISNPGCGGCAEGQIGMTGTGEVQVSTSNRNFNGKQGKGLTYLASPATAAASAVKGFITPAEFTELKEASVQ